YEKSKTDRVRLLKEYYASNPGAEKQPKDRDLALPIQECYKKHDRLTLKDPEKGLHPEKIKRRQIVRTIMAMWSREELPDDPIMAVMNSTIKQRSFTEKFNELYDEKLSTRDVVRRMEMAQHELHEIKMAEIKKTWARMRKHHRQEGANLNLGNFIKS
ncbi:MAG: hypothetical protein NTX92_08130, partial [Euryarchaeota archaeon]|nr:hypothetical protein [Euryarchaeota archaeon]